MKFRSRKPLPTHNLTRTGMLQIRALIREEVRAAITDGIGACLLQPAPTPTSAELTPSLQLQLDDPAQNSLPPNLHVPRAVQERISRGEFIDFDQLLPEVLGAHDPSARKSLEFRSNAGGALELVEVGASHPVRRRVHDIGTWLEAWTMYMHAICTIAPHRMSELLSYQAMILAANRQFYSEAWLSYDQQFRMLIAFQPGRRFDSIAINTWQLCVTSKARPRCSCCNIVHPASTNCPFVPNSRIKAHHQGCSPATARANLSAATSISANAATRTAALPTPATAVAKTTLASNA